MPIVLDDMSGMAQGIQQAGGALAQGLATGLEQRAQKRLQREQSSALQAALADESLDLQTQRGQQDFLRRTTAAGIPTQDALGILDRAIKQEAAAKQPFGTDDPEQLAGLFNRLGVPEDQARDYADLYGNLSQGGRTSFANMFIENLQRGSLGQPQQPQSLDEIVGQPQPQQQPFQQPQAQPPEQVIEQASEEFVFPEVSLFEGLVPKEKVQREKELFNANAKDYNDLAQKVKSAKNDGMRVELLERYNNSGKLPEGMEKLNINWKTGDIRFPALANAETQAFVKTINDFTVKAKETFGARVTNFELQSFMRRLPTLANSPEGRRLIISQMKSMSDLDRLEKESLKTVYDQYGLRGIDAQKAENIAEQMRAPEEERIKQAVFDSVDAQNVYDAKEKAPAEKIVARDPDGKIVYIWASARDKAEERGYQIL